MSFGGERRTAFALKREPKGRLYADILRYSLSQCSMGLVMVRPTLSVGAHMREVLEFLRRFALPADETQPWAGPELFDSGSEWLRFSFCEEVLAYLLSCSTRLYEWQQPLLPEDLCLFRADGSDWLVTAAHSRSAYLLLSREEKSAFVQAVPRLATLVS